MDHLQPRSTIPLKTTYPKVKVDDFVGNQHVVQALHTVFRCATSQRKCTKNFQAICPKTIFLPGTSGVGKTKLVQQMACQYSLGLIHVSPANLLSKYIGESHINISLMFDYLKEEDNCILFLDEVDGLVSKRNSDENTEQSGLNGLLQIFLTELSTFVDHDDGCHFIIAASNKPFNLDEAFVQRFDLTCALYLPKFEDRRLLIWNGLYHAYGSHIYTLEEVAKLADATEGISCRQIMSNLKQAFVQQCSIEMKHGRYLRYENQYYACYDNLRSDAVFLQIDEIPIDTLRVNRISLSNLLQCLKRKPKNSIAEMSQLNAWMRKNDTKIFTSSENHCEKENSLSVCGDYSCNIL